MGKSLFDKARVELFSLRRPPLAIGLTLGSALDAPLALSPKNPINHCHVTRLRRDRLQKRVGV